MKEETNGLEAVISSGALAAECEASLPSFPEAVETHKAMVYSILWHFLRNRALADEAAQDIFFELHRNWKKLESPAHLVGWLRRVTTHRAIDQVRKQKTRPETSLEESSEPTVLERVHDSFLSRYIQRMVATLPAQQRIIIILRYQEEMAVEDIAGVLGMKASTVKTQIARALDLLRTKTAHRLKGETSARTRDEEH